jgi:hypothetical protein
MLSLGCDLKRLWEIVQEEGHYVCDDAVKNYVWNFLKSQPCIDIVVYESSKKRKKDQNTERWNIWKPDEREQAPWSEIETLYKDKLKIIAILECRRRALYNDIDVRK